MQSSRLLIDEPPLQVLPTLAALVGLEESVVLQQIHYWCRQMQNTFDGHLWVYNTLDEWLVQFPWIHNVKKMQRLMADLEEGGLVICCQPEQFNRRKWYRVNYELLNELLETSVVHDDTFGTMDSPVFGAVEHTENGVLLTETTTETTTETPVPSVQAPASSSPFFKKKNESARAMPKHPLAIATIPAPSEQAQLPEQTVAGDEETLNHPACLAFRHVFNLTLGPVQRRRVIQVVGNRPESFVHWEKTITYWKKRKWNPLDLDGLLDRFQRTFAVQATSLSPRHPPQDGVMSRRQRKAQQTVAQFRDEAARARGTQNQPFTPATYDEILARGRVEHRDDDP